MLFKTHAALESEKERNFYSKVFAGYYFNELIPGYETRLHRLTSLLKNTSTTTFNGPVTNSLKFEKESTHVTFDFHGYLLNEKTDRGELADILIEDISNNSTVAIEVKFLSDWKFEKDIVTASKRLKALLDSKNVSSFVHVLLVTKSKLEGVKGAVNRADSQWKKLLDFKTDYPIVVLTWEEIADIIDGPEGKLVKHFINEHVTRSREDFRINARGLLELR